MKHTSTRASAQDQLVARSPLNCLDAVDESACALFTNSRDQVLEGVDQGLSPGMRFKMKYLGMDPTGCPGSQDRIPQRCEEAIIRAGTVPYLEVVPAGARKAGQALVSKGRCEPTPLPTIGGPHAGRPRPKARVIEKPAPKGCNKPLRLQVARRSVPPDGMSTDEIPQPVQLVLKNRPRQVCVPVVVMNAVQPDFVTKTTEVVVKGVIVNVVAAHDKEGGRNVFCSQSFRDVTQETIPEAPGGIDVK